MCKPGWRSLPLAVAIAACSSQPSQQLSELDARKLLVDRTWIDHMPEGMTDQFHLYRFESRAGAGVFQERRMFKGTFELFSFKIERGCLEFELPETHQTASSQFSIERVRGHAPFDIQLILKDDPRGPYVYYSKSSEADRDGQILEAKLAAIRATN